MEPRADTLTAYYNGKPIFTSNGNWLHPLFELERYLAAHSYDAADIHVEDTIIGKAAAILICRMGIKSLKVGTLSVLGERVLKDESVDYAYDTMIDRVFCQTEDLLEAVDDFDEAYGLLCERAGR
jgi:hypothetical protein